MGRIQLLHSLTKLRSIWSVVELHVLGFFSASLRHTRPADVRVSRGSSAVNNDQWPKSSEGGHCRGPEFAAAHTKLLAL